MLRGQEGAFVCFFARTICPLPACLPVMTFIAVFTFAHATFVRVGMLRCAQIAVMYIMYGDMIGVAIMDGGYEKVLYIFMCLGVDTRLGYDRV